MTEAVHEDLVRSGVVAPVELGGSDERLWLDCDLASLAENRLGDRTDPHDLDEARRADWTARATTERPWSVRRRSEYERCYWLLEGVERVGTVSVARSTLGSESLRIGSFYVLPAHRSRGTGRRALGRLEEVLGRHRLGIRLETSWCWPRTVRFYLRAGMWIYMWKRELSFFWNADTPPHRIAIGEHEATLSVTRGKGEDVVLARARRRGEVLELDEPARKLQKDRSLGEAWWHAESTLALAIALEGWPLVRSQEAWDDCHTADGGPPESLAYKITIWEAWDRKHGWRVETPRIAGLAYPTWDELDAGWEKRRQEFEAELARNGGVVKPRAKKRG